MLELLLSLMLQAKAKFSDFCTHALERHVIADDPWPHAEAETKTLVNAFVANGSPAIMKELKFRVSVGMVSESELGRMIQVALDGRTR